MSWERLERSFASREFPDSVRVNHRNKQFVVSVGREIAAKLQWRVGTKVSLFVGTAENAGRLRVVDNGEGIYTLRPISKNSASLRVVRGGLPGIQRKAFPMEVIKHAYIEGGIEFALPRTWFVVTSAAAEPEKRPQGHPSLPVDETAKRENAFIHAVAECYRQGITPSYADLARLSKIPQGSVGEMVGRMAKEGRITRDEHGIRPRNALPARPRATA